MSGAEASHRSKVRLGVVVVLVLLALTVAALATAWLAPDSQETAGPSGSFCLSFEDPGDNVAEARRALAGTPEPDDLSLATQRGAAHFAWAVKTAAGAPSELEADARRVAAAMRSALLDDHPEALESPEFQRSLRRLERDAPKVCSGRGG